MRDGIVNGEKGEEADENFNIAQEISSEMRELAWEHRQKIREYNCDGSED